jgi:hypothetical protein
MRKEKIEKRGITRKRESKALRRERARKMERARDRVR